ncbi:uncharacterized protein TNCV_3266131 [Trichonephila clavipes]|nr:uncharacterized protein TNCV_3266131 [Trichonephila clavipes]
MGQKNILFNGCTTTGFEIMAITRLVDLIIALQGSAYFLEDSWHLTYFPVATNIRFLQLKERASRIPKESVNSIKNQSQIIFYSHLRKSGMRITPKRDQWIREMSFTSRPGSGYPRQTSHREDHHIVRNALVQLTDSSAAIKAHVAPTLGPLCLLEIYEGAWLKDIWNRDVYYV